MLVEIVDRRHLHDPAEVHHRNAVAHVADDREIVRDEEVGEPQLALQVGEQIEDLRPDRDVERRDRLVADDEVGMQGDGAGNADALALTAGEVAGKPVVVLRVEADQLPSARARASRALRHSPGHECRTDRR